MSRHLKLMYGLFRVILMQVNTERPLVIVYSDPRFALSRRIKLKKDVHVLEVDGRNIELFSWCNMIDHSRCLELEKMLPGG